MKKTLLISLLAFLGAQMCGCGALLSSQQYRSDTGYDQPSDIGDEYRPEGEYTYDDNYADVDWDNVDPADMYYSYYDSDNVFMCAFGNRIFMIPYDFFYDNIWSHHRFGFHYYPYSYFANWWGIGLYNHVWDRYYWRHHNGYYRRGYNYYNQHRSHPPTVLRRGELRDPRFGRNSGNFNRYNRSSKGNYNFGSRSNRFSNRYESRSTTGRNYNYPSTRFSNRYNRNQRASSGNSNFSNRYYSPRSSTGTGSYSSGRRSYSSSYGSSRGGQGSSGYSTRGRSFSSSGSSGGGHGGSGGSSQGHAVRKR